MRVCHVISGLTVGGAETMLCTLLDSLAALEIQQSVAVLGAEGPLSSRIRRSGIEIAHLGMMPGRFSAAALQQLRKWIRGRRPDVIHGWMYHANLMTTLAGIGTGIPVLWAIHQTLYDIRHEKRTTQFVIRANKALSRMPRQIVYCSAISLEQHKAFGFRSRKPLLIPNGFDVARFRPDAEARARVRAQLDMDPGDFAIGLAARWHPMKDHANFLRAAARFACRDPRSVFVLAGEGLTWENTELADQIRAFDLSERVRLCGRRDDMPAFHAALDVLSSSSSHGEAFPMMLGEAMACGTPCVATDVGDAAAIIGDTGVIVPPRDAAALSGGWARLADLDIRDRQTLGMRARQRIIQNFAQEAVGHRFKELYRELTATPP
jgi:glycosyltransferase involved in cell wall biosynthesis